MKRKRVYRRLAPNGSRQPRTIEELLDPCRVWVTPYGCWLWLGGDDGYGDENGRGAYGRILRPGTRRVMPIHRYVWEVIMGFDIPEGHDLDHKCCGFPGVDRLAIRRCCNPDHLRPVTPKLNQQLKLLRRLGYYDEFDAEGWQPEADYHHPPGILAPGETCEDLYYP